MENVGIQELGIKEGQMSVVPGYNAPTLVVSATVLLAHTKKGMV